MTAVEVCPICYIAGCRHIRERNGQGSYSPAEAMRRQYDEVLRAGNRTPEPRGPLFNRDDLGADEIPVGPDTETPEQIAARARREALEEAAETAWAHVKWYQNQYDNITEIGTSNKAAIRALIDKEPRT